MTEEMETDNGSQIVQPSTRPRWVRLFASLSPAVLFLGLLSIAVFRSDTKAVSGKEAPSFELPFVGWVRRVE